LKKEIAHAHQDYDFEKLMDDYNYLVEK